MLPRVKDSLNPSVNEQETDDYDRYISHPQSLPLVVSAEEPIEADHDYQDYQEFLNGSWQTQGLLPTGSEEDFAVYSDLLHVSDNPLNVTEGDAQKKRYKAYKKWLMGKSLFKQQPVD